MSGTPRTDKEVIDFPLSPISGYEGPIRWVPAQFSETLERELTAANARIAEFESGCVAREADTRQLVLDLMELALDNKLPEEDRSFMDSARRYCELRNEAVRLGYRKGKLVPLDDRPRETGETCKP